MAAIDRRRLMALGLGAAGLLPAARALRAQEYETPRANWPTPPRRVEVRAPPARVNPVAFWNDACLQLVALDHSIDAADSRAPGPCAAAKALALAHIVMADAVAAVYPVDYEAFAVRGVRFDRMEYPEAFVGGAVARMLEHIYNTPAHTQFIGAQRLQFLKQLDGGALEAWNAGLSFARADAFTARWNWPEIKYAAVQSSAEYRPRPGEHEVDPFNPDQKYYGATWGQQEPLVRELRHAAVGPGEPPREHDREFRHDAAEVREIGAFNPRGPARDQVRSGLYWAYDGPRLIGPPPRQYNQFVRQICEHDGLSVPETVRALALCNLAMSDAGVVCWEAKYRYKVWRPVVALPRLYGERGWRPFGSPRSNPAQFSLGSDTQFRLTAQSMLGGGERHFSARSAKEYLPYEEACFTPNFPSYPSGHATFGSACFNMLKHVRAERAETRRDPGRLDGALEFISDELNGVSIDHFRNEPRLYLPIAYRHLDKMIEDNNKSRVHLGVHWDFDCKHGAASGLRIAEVVYRNAYRRRGDSYRER
jgi:hypothetical protein